MVGLELIQCGYNTVEEKTISLLTREGEFSEI